MRAALGLVAALLLLAPLAWALAGDAAQEPGRAERWLYLQPLTALCLFAAWRLRAREVAAWPRGDAVVLAARQTGVYEPGVLAMRLELAHARDGETHTVVTKARVPAAETARYAVGEKVRLAVNPRDPREGEVTTSG